MLINSISICFHSCCALVLTILLLTTAADTTLASSPAGGLDTDVVINEVFYNGNADQDWIELLNTGDSAIDISAWWFCSRFAYRPLSTRTILVGDDLLLEPGEIIVLSTGIDIDGSTGADMGLYITNSFGNSNNMVDFLQWITPSQIGRSNEAIIRNFWSGNINGPVDFVERAEPDESVAFCGINSGGGLLTLSSDFVNSQPSMGMPNTVNCDEGLIFIAGFESLLR